MRSIKRYQSPRRWRPTADRTMTECGPSDYQGYVSLSDYNTLLLALKLERVSLMRATALIKSLKEKPQ